MCARVDGTVAALDTPIGRLPHPGDLDLSGLDIAADTLRALLHVDVDAWRAELPDIESHFAQFGRRYRRG